jgi:hypothetical protein
MVPSLEDLGGEFEVDLEELEPYRLKFNAELFSLLLITHVRYAHHHECGI